MRLAIAAAEDGAASAAAWAVPPAAVAVPRPVLAGAAEAAPPRPALVEAAQVAPREAEGLRQAAGEAARAAHRGAEAIRPALGEAARAAPRGAEARRPALGGAAVAAPRAAEGLRRALGEVARAAPRAAEASPVLVAPAATRPAIRWRRPASKAVPPGKNAPGSGSPTRQPRLEKSAARRPAPLRSGRPVPMERSVRPRAMTTALPAPSASVLCARTSAASTGARRLRAGRARPAHVTRICSPTARTTRWLARASRAAIP